MPVFLALLAAAGAVVFWILRARNAAQAAGELADMAGDVLSAARRFGFRRRHDEHPVDSLQEPDVAIAGLGMAFMELGGLPSREQQAAMLVSLQHHLGHDFDRAQEAQLLGRWLVTECGGPQPGFTRLAKRLVKLGGGAASFDPCMAVLRDVAAESTTGQITPQQKDALEELARAFRLH